jgi:hypothetical protein
MILQKTCTPESLFPGEWFSVTYRIYGNENDARAKAEATCIEQTGHKMDALSLIHEVETVTGQEFNICEGELARTHIAAVHSMAKAEAL